MNRQPDAIEKYLRLVESSSITFPVEDTSFEDIEIIDMPYSDPLLEDINDLIFKFRSYSENSGSSEYINGVEEGLVLASNMLERLLNQYSNPSD